MKVGPDRQEHGCSQSYLRTAELGGRADIRGLVHREVDQDRQLEEFSGRSRRRAPRPPWPPRGNPATWTGHAGDPAAAHDQVAALLPVREGVSGVEYPDTLTARDNVATGPGRRGTLKRPQPVRRAATRL